MAQRTPATIGSDTAQGPDMGPKQVAGRTQGGAPGGLTPGVDLPSVAVPGGRPASTNGYMPTAGQPKLPTPGSDQGGGKA